MKLLKSLIHKEVRSLYEELVSIRRHLHANPELSFKEKNTSAFIRQILDREGISYTSGYCKYGIVADIRGKKKQKTIYLRGDMDALPIQEVPGRTYGSNVKGVMHACGHDVHTTCVLGSAIILNRLKSHINGTIKIIFQPGEEKLPGGASLMIKEGAVTTDGSSFIYGQHVHPPLETGMVGFRPGEYMASADELFIKVRGKGGHAALPQDCIDTVLVGSEIVTSLHQLVSRVRPAG
ncbi:MAG: M20 metallopeptidase family protein, partial [Saprospiraceae bacterium]